MLEWHSKLGRKPRLLFIAHRKENPQPSLGRRFVALVCGTKTLGSLVDGNDPGQRDHLFCSIQSYNSRSLIDEAAIVQYIVVGRVSSRRPRRATKHYLGTFTNILLGSDSNAERSDQLDVLIWFRWTSSAEIDA